MSGSSSCLLRPVDIDVRLPVHARGLLPSRGSRAGRGLLPACGSSADEDCFPRADHARPSSRGLLSPRRPAFFTGLVLRGSGLRLRPSHRRLATCGDRHVAGLATRPSQRDPFVAACHLFNWRLPCSVCLLLKQNRGALHVQQTEGAVCCLYHCGNRSLSPSSFVSY